MVRLTEYECDTSITRTSWNNNTSLISSTNIIKSEVSGDVPQLKNGMPITFTNRKNKKVNGIVKSTSNDGYVDVFSNKKVYLCVWKYKWIEIC